MPNPAGLTILSLVSRVARLTLELDIDAQPVSGQLQLDGSIARDFDGWLELTSLTETIRNMAKASADTPRRGTGRAAQGEP
jgi:hypothetical protein